MGAVQVDIEEAEARFSQLIDRAAAGQEVVIARNGRPVTRLVPLQRQLGKRIPGAWKGKVWIAPDFDETDPEIIDMFENGPVFPDKRA